MNSIGSGNMSRRKYVFSQIFSVFINIFSHWQILSLEWDRGIENLKCVNRVDLSLYGSFADMVVSPSSDARDRNGNLLFTLTSPGQLHVYDKACLSSLLSQQKDSSVSAVPYNMVVPTTEPNMTVAKLDLVHGDGDLSKFLSQVPDKQTTS